jgi:hypothetical protein
MNTILNVYVNTYLYDIIDLDTLNRKEHLFRLNMLTYLNMHYFINDKHTLIRISNEMSSAIIMAMKTFIIYDEVLILDRQVDLFLQYYDYFINNLDPNFKNPLNTTSIYNTSKRFKVNQIINKIYRQINICIQFLNNCI